MELQMELTRRDIPFEVRSGLRFFEQAHIKDVVAFLKVIVNPTDEVSWKRILKMFPKIGKKTADRIYDYIKNFQDPVSLFIDNRIGDQFKGIQKENLEALASLFKELEGLQKFESPADMISAVLHHGYAEYARYTYANHESRLEDINQLINFSTGYRSLITFLSELSLMSGITGEEVVTGGEEDEKVILSTVHQAKGLEWKAVFVIWCAEGRFPNPKAVEEGETEEERRLFYVAATRAMDELYLCYPLLLFEKQVGHVILKPSRFIAELESGCYEEWQIGEV
jgi:DNA helicase-2/ATP-dependent DNA helicase PcrA